MNLKIWFRFSPKVITQSKIKYFNAMFRNNNDQLSNLIGEIKNLKSEKELEKP